MVYDEVIQTEAFLEKACENIGCFATFILNQN